jgi:2-amino-4-hydroxy-6-hydroxymethyldihydropteridine diphosphokinase
MILVAIGANLPGPLGTPPIETCRLAAAALDSLAGDALRGLQLRALSRWYRTAPVPPSGQPSYVNAVAVLRCEPGAASPDPGVLLAALQALEARAGRVRGAPNAARTLDLDIIAMGRDGGLVRASPDPVLPHPRSHERGFVLVPLLDVAPWWIHPVLRRGARDLLRDLPAQGVEPL